VKVVILAGGKGSRLGLNDVPKGLVPVNGVPLLERTVRGAIRDGFTDFIFLTGYLADSFKEHFSDGSSFGASIQHVVELEPLGTAGSFNQIRDQLNEPFVVVYGDVLMDVDLRAFAGFARDRGGAGTLFVHPNDHPFDSDLVETDYDDRIVAFHPKPHKESDHYPNLVSAALYVLSPVALDFIPDGQSDWGHDVFPRLTQSEALYGYRSCEYVKDIGTQDRLDRAQRQLQDGTVERLALRTAKPAVFLDRDGVINVEVDGAYSADKVQLIPGTAEAIRTFNDAAIPVICVTNQPGLAKGFMSWKDLRTVTGEIDHQLAAEAGAYLDDIRVCPHHPESGWAGEVASLKVECECRKPKDGLLRDAAEMHNIDLSRSWLIGDRYCDIAAARSAGVRSVLVLTGYAGSDRERFSCEPDHVCDDLASAAKLIHGTMM
jgi:mannose-1-phosphate guanylyltransferase/phosphomannomutase